MNRIIFILFTVIFTSCNGQNNNITITEKRTEMKKYPIEKTTEQWKQQLSEDEYTVLRNKGTERPFTGKYNDFSEKGVYYCKGCNTKLFSSDMKFDSHCGWPSFDKELPDAKIEQIRDTTHGMVRTEIVCSNCGGHLGHIFNDGPTATGMRYCVNSVSIDFKEEK